MISVICPTLNEVRFIRAWCEQVTKYSDDIHVADCGSTDGTLEILKEYNINVSRAKIVSPYIWEEGKIRNSLIDRCKYDWILNLDADELLGDEFRIHLPRVFASKKKFLRMEILYFWGGVNTVRKPNPELIEWLHFRKRQIRLFRNDPKLRYQETGNLAGISYRGLPPRLFWGDLDVRFFHYHFAAGWKAGGNRNGELMHSGIRLETYFGNHPEEAKFYSWFDSRRMNLYER